MVGSSRCQILVGKRGREEFEGAGQRQALMNKYNLAYLESIFGDAVKPTGFGARSRGKTQLRMARTGARSNMHPCPMALRSDNKVQDLLLRCFPKAFEDDLRKRNLRQHERAALWAAVILLYFRTGLSRGQVASQLNEFRDTGPRGEIGTGNLHFKRSRKALISAHHIGKIVEHINAELQNQRHDNRKPHHGKRGRPSKKTLTPKIV